jgi:signal transduction histidine kinase
MEVMADSTGVRQVLFNIIKNALEAMRNGGRLSVIASTDSSHSSLTVSDSGTGIHPDDLDRVFQLHFTTKRQGGGSGIGLYLSRQLARQMGGDLTFKSDFGSGSHFTLLLHSSVSELERGQR